MARALLIAFIAVTGLAGCKKRELRGWVESSSDGKSRLAIEDDCNGAPMWVDGKRWPAPRSAPVEVAAGDHDISCGDRPDPESGMSVTVKPGTVFHFDYWGP